MSGAKNDHYFFPIDSGARRDTQKFLARISGFYFVIHSGLYLKQHILTFEKILINEVHSLSILYAFVSDGSCSAKERKGS